MISAPRSPIATTSTVPAAAMSNASVSLIRERTPSPPRISKALATEEEDAAFIEASAEAMATRAARPSSLIRRPSERLISSNGVTSASRPTRPIHPTTSRLSGESVPGSVGASRRYKRSADTSMEEEIVPETSSRRTSGERRSPTSISGPMSAATSYASDSPRTGDHDEKTPTDPTPASATSGSTTVVPPAPSTAFKYETPLLSRESRVLRSAQTTVPGSTTRPIPRTAPRSTAKTIRSSAAVRAKRVVEYIDPDEEDEDENLDERGVDKEDGSGSRSGSGSGHSGERAASSRPVVYDDDLESPGVARGMPLATVREKERSDSARLLEEQLGERNPFDSRDTNGRSVSPLDRASSLHHALPQTHRKSSPRIPGEAVTAEGRSGSNLPGYELGAGDEEEVDDGYGGARAPPAARSEAYPLGRRQPSSAPTSEDDPYFAQRGANHKRAVSSAAAIGAPVSARKPISTSTSTTLEHGAPNRRTALGEVSASNLNVLPTVPVRAVSQPPIGSGTELHPKRSSAAPAQPRASVLEDTAVLIKSDSEEYKMLVYEESLMDEAVRQRKLPAGKTDEWTRGKVVNGNYRDLKPTTVRGFRYRKVRKAGEGGFSTVWVVRGPCEKIETKEEYLEDQQAFFAMKQVNLKKLEPQSREEVLKEAEYLEALARIPNYDRYMLRYFAHKSNENHLKILIELGDRDFSDVLRERIPTRWELSHIFCQMIEAVHFLHEAGIVHTDLKPANFLQVGESIKIIDLGIAQKIPMGTIHISRDALVGTPNYMAPETVKMSRTRGEEGRSSHIFKAGKASDVWSMGCILYQMVYGRPPFDKLTGEAKLKAICSERHVIEFPPHRVRDDPSSEMVDEHLIDCMRQALQYHVAKRATIPELLAHPFARPHTFKDEQAVITREVIYKMVTRIQDLTLMGRIAKGSEAQMVENLFQNLLKNEDTLR